MYKRQELQRFAKQLEDRFGAVPKQTTELMDTIRLRRLAKDIGFEKVVLKQQTFVGYFVQNQQSEFYQSPFFGMLMQYLSRYPAKARLKERNNKLTLVMEQMRSIDQVVQALKQITDALKAEPEKQA